MNFITNCYYSTYNGTVVIEYLKTENVILKEKIGKKRIILNDDQMRKLAILGKNIWRKGLNEICNVFSPDTILKWHRALIAKKYDGSKNRKYGRPQISEELKNIIIKVAKANRGWGYNSKLSQQFYRSQE